MQRMGFSYDWSREVATCLPEYYRWNQWFFLKMCEQGEVYRAKRKVNWCRVRARCWPTSRWWTARAGARPRRWSSELEQWFLPSPTTPTSCCRAWTRWTAGRRRSAPCSGTGSAAARARGSTSPGRTAARRKITVFTTRLDTLYGVTFMLLAPEHPLVEGVATDAGAEGLRRAGGRPEARA